jgi:protein gp37
MPIEWLADLLSLIHATPFLDWQLLTKRPENWKARIEAAADSCPEREMRSTPAQYGYATLLYRWLDEWLDGSPPANVWLGTTVEDQTRADSRIPALLSIPAKVRFLSCEPLLGPVHRSHVRETRTLLPRFFGILSTVHPLFGLAAGSIG